MVDIINFTKYKVSKSYFEKIIKKSLVYLKKKTDLPISLVFVGFDKMKDLNYRYRNIKKSTDVLSFPYLAFENAVKKNIGRGGKEFYFGEIIVCVPYAEKNAKINHYSLKRELAFLVVHGVLHIFGIDHEKNEKEAKKMEIMEKEILKKL